MRDVITEREGRAGTTIGTTGREEGATEGAGIMETAWRDGRVTEGTAGRERGAGTTTGKGTGREERATGRAGTMETATAGRTEGRAEIMKGSRGIRGCKERVFCSNQNQLSNLIGIIPTHRTSYHGT